MMDLANISEAYAKERVREACKEKEEKIKELEEYLDSYERQTPM